MALDIFFCSRRIGGSTAPWFGEYREATPRPHRRLCYAISVRRSLPLGSALAGGRLRVDVAGGAE